MTASPLWELRSITKTYPGVRANDGISLSLHEGRIHGLLGENGCGKSTLIKILSGVNQPDEGELLRRGRPVNLSTAAFPCPRFEGIAPLVARHGSITRALAQLGVADYTRARSVVSTRLPTQAEADLLSRPATQPVLVVEYVNVDGEGMPVEAGMTLFAADAVQLVVEPDAMG